MTTVSRVIRSSRVIVAGEVRRAAIHVTAGVITAIAAWDDIPADAELTDYGDLVVMAGVVDSHVHVNEPGRTEWEGFETATSAAAAGGVSTIVDMPLNSIPPTTTVANLEAKLRAMEGKCRVDAGLWGGAISGNAADLSPLLDAGVLGFKCFLIDSGVDEFPSVNAGELRTAMEIIGAGGAPLLVHAELEGPIAAAVPEGPPTSYSHYLHSRPPEAEIEAIDLVCRTLRETSARAHIVHLSAAGALPLIVAAKREGLRLTVETTPHYLSLESEEVPDGATQFKCAPPIRERANQEQLWDALVDGTIDMIVSDHSPCIPSLKNADTGDFMTAWGGISSMQLLLPVAWTEASKRGVKLPAMSRWLSEAPAELAGLSAKGRLEPGFDADFVIWDPDVEFIVDPSHLEHRHRITPYAGRMLRGVVQETWLRGECIYRNGTHVGAPSGRWLRRGSA